jgi:subtilisin family serine protease
MQKSILSLALATVLTCFCITASRAQTEINAQWQVVTGYAASQEWHSQVKCSNGDLVTVGNTFTAGEGVNILVTRLDIEGQILWQATYNSLINANDYASGVYESPTGAIYVVGARDSVGGVLTANIIVYSGAGVLLWSKEYRAGNSINNVFSCVTVDPAGNVFCAGASQRMSTGFDYLLTKYDTSGALSWATFYDHAGYYDAAASISLTNAAVAITGASGTNNSNVDIAIARFNYSGSFLSEARNTSSGLGIDKPIAFIKDANGNSFVVGTVNTLSSGKDIKVIKYDSVFNILWSQQYDGFGQDDEALDAKLNGLTSVVISGYCSNANGIKKSIILQYDLTGLMINSINLDNGDDAVETCIPAIDLGAAGTIVFAEQFTNGTQRHFSIGKLDNNLITLWSKDLLALGQCTLQSIVSSGIGDARCSFMNVGTGGCEVLCYREFTRSSEAIVDTAGRPQYKQHEVIVKLRPNLLKADVVNDGSIHFGSLEEFLTQEASYGIDSILSSVCTCNSLLNTANEGGCNVKVIKIFNHLTPSNASTTTRLGENIDIPDFWNAVVFTLGDCYTVADVLPILNSNKQYIEYAEPNYLGSFASGGYANDQHYYTKQHSIGGSGVYANIGADSAWYDEVGRDFIKVGVIDDGISWNHEDFGYDGANPSTSRVVDGWNYILDEPLKFKLNNTLKSHGTKAAGIIGAIRNNAGSPIGIAGIAGGDDAAGVSGVSLYGLKVELYDTIVPMDQVIPAIVMSCIDDTASNTYAVHILNNSWRFDNQSILPATATDSNLLLLSEAVRFANRAKVLFVACRGNEGYDNFAYPAIIDDDWVLSVGATDATGLRAVVPGLWASSYGHNMDVGAPGVNTMVYTTNCAATNCGGSPRYFTFDGTSAAAPHVSGIAALMMSYYNQQYANNRNLSPEDCEHLIEKTADNFAGTTYNQQTGWGLAKANRALDMLDTTHYAIVHEEANPSDMLTNNFGYQLVSSGLLVNLKERARNNYIGSYFAPGRYKVNVFKANVVHHHLLGIGDSLVDYWPRPSSSVTLDSITNGNLFPRERLTVVSCTKDSSNMTGFVYQVLDTAGNFLGWIPGDTALKTRMAYSMHVYNAVATHILPAPISTNNTQISFLPNPTSNDLTMSYFSNENCTLDISIFDAVGKNVMQTTVCSTFGENRHKFDMARLAPGTYVVQVRKDAQPLTNCKISKY